MLQSERALNKKREVLQRDQSDEHRKKFITVVSKISGVKLEISAPYASQSSVKAEGFIK